MKLYGIPNCNTVKKARDWLEKNRIEVEFHDFKKLGLDPASAKNWLKQTEWENLVNRSGMTWRGLTDAQKKRVKDESSALKLMLEKTSVIKRPVLEKNGKVLHIGFDEAAYSKLFKQKS